MTSHDSSTPARDRWALATVLSLALGLRLWGIGFGLPHLEARPDEIEVVARAIRLLSGDLNPHAFHYPSLYYYVLGVLYALWGGVVVVFGGSWGEFLSDAAIDPGGFVLIGRWVSAIAGVATVYVVYRIAHKLNGRLAGLIAGMSLAVAHLHVRDSHFATTDIMMTLFLAAAVLHILDVAERGALPAYLWAGVFTGFAISTKYVGLILPGVLVFAHTLWHLTAAQLTRSDWTRLDRAWLERARVAARDPSLWAFMGASLAAFVLTTPFAVLDWGLFTTHFRFQLGHLAGGHGVDLGIGGIYHLWHTLPKGLGWPVFVVAGVGFSWAMLRHPRRAAVLFLFPALFYLSTVTGRTVFLRYMIPLLPFFCIAVGWWLSDVVGRVGGRSRWLLLGGAVLLWGVPLADSVRTDRLLSQPDTRNQAADWLVAEVGPGDHSIHQTGAQWGRLQLPLTTASLTERRDAARRARPVPALARLRAYTLMQAEARLAAGQARDVGFEPVSFDPDQRFPADAQPEWIAVMRSPLLQYSEVSSELETILARDYEVAMEFPAARPGSPGWYDQHDAFYLPFKGMGAVARPGPDVTLYRRSAVPDASPTNTGVTR